MHLITEVVPHRYRRGASWNCELLWQPISLEHFNDLDFANEVVHGQITLLRIKFDFTQNPVPPSN